MEKLYGTFRRRTLEFVASNDANMSSIVIANVTLEEKNIIWIPNQNYNRMDNHKREGQITIKVGEIQTCTLIYSVILLMIFEGAMQTN